MSRVDYSLEGMGDDVGHRVRGRWEGGHARSSSDWKCHYEITPFSQFMELGNGDLHTIIITKSVI